MEHLFQVASDGAFVSGSIVSMRQVVLGGQPIRDPANRALERISRLTREDIPETLRIINISDTGEITRI